MGEEPDWPPPDARLTAILWRAESHLERGEFSAAARAVDEAVGLGEDDLLRGLRHLAAAGYKRQEGDVLRSRRQLAHARRRLESFLPSYREVDLAGLLRIVESPGGELA